MYVTHHPNKHDENAAFWKKTDPSAKKNANKANNDSVQKPSTPASTSSASLGLNDRLKQVLLTTGCLSETDVEKIFKEAEQGN